MKQKEIAMDPSHDVQMKLSLVRMENVTQCSVKVGRQDRLVECQEGFLVMVFFSSGPYRMETLE